jgi:hypothetical protein
MRLQLLRAFKSNHVDRRKLALKRDIHANREATTTVQRLESSHALGALPRASR